MTLARSGTRALQSTVLDWYARSGRDLAFRRSTDPWSALVSEVMAQQTQAARAASAWAAFMERYPTPADFAAASPAEAIRAWRGLGYNRRAIALRAAAVRIVTDHAGHVPVDLQALEALPGIGPYTARAVLAIAFGRPVAALDTNIRRVLDRAVGPLPSTAIDRQGAADGLVPRRRAAEWTHALMDIGASFCRKREPRCADCPLAARCAFATSGARAAPLVVRKQKPRVEPFESTNRWLRGRILDRLRDVPDGAWQAFESALGEHDLEAVLRALARLAAEGFLELHPDLPGHARLAST